MANDAMVGAHDLFEVGGGCPLQPRRRLVASLIHALIELPGQIVRHAEAPGHRSAASRDLRRGGAMGVEPLTRAEHGLDGWKRETPLWFTMADLLPFAMERVP